jgi:hypothetical protein
MRVMLRGAVAVATLLAAGQAAAQPATNAVKGFSIVLVEGSLQPGGSVDLPAPARAAIDDIKDFLPFKSFRLLDASWMLGTTGVPSRLSAGDQDYDVAVAVTPLVDGKTLAVKFLLRAVANRQVSALEANRSKNQQLQELDMLRRSVAAEYKMLEALRLRLDDKHPDVQRAEQSVARARERLRWAEQSQINSFRWGAPDQPGPAPGTATAVIDTSFSMRIGETVVVGTSRVNGERALIALMTAVSK